MNRSASVYASSLYSLAAEENIAFEILNQMDGILKIFASEPDFVFLLSSPGISKDERTGMLDACLREKIQPYLLNFLKILTERELIGIFGECCESYRKLYNEANGLLPVSVVSAVALDESRKARLKEKLDKLTGKNTQLVCRVDASCIGGIRLDFDDKQIDGTVKNRLAAVAQLLKDNAF